MLVEGASGSHYNINLTPEDGSNAFLGSSYMDTKLETAATSAIYSWYMMNYRHVVRPYKTSNISRTLVGNTIVDNSDEVGASPVGAAPTTSSFST